MELLLVFRAHIDFFCKSTIYIHHISCFPQDFILSLIMSVWENLGFQLKWAYQHTSLILSHFVSCIVVNIIHVWYLVGHGLMGQSCVCLTHPSTHHLYFILFILLSHHYECVILPQIGLHLHQLRAWCIPQIVGIRMWDAMGFDRALASDLPGITPGWIFYNTTYNISQSHDLMSWSLHKWQFGPTNYPNSPPEKTLDVRRTSNQPQSGNQ